MNFNPSTFFDLSAFSHKDVFSVDNVWDVLKKIPLYLRSHHLGIIDVDVPSTVHLVEPHLISIGKNTVLEPGAYIKGPCIIGENCTIRQGAYIRGDFICGTHCVIGHDTEIKNSIFLNYSQAAHFAYIGDSILGNRVNLGAGVKCANLRLDHKNIKISFENQIIETNLRKMGAIIGDESQLGCNSVTNPGTLIGKHCFLHPLTNFGGILMENHGVKSSQSGIIFSL